MAKKKTQEREHALLSASSSHIWLHCTAMPRATEHLPDTTSEAAEEGTLAHSICELKLSKAFTDQNMTERIYKGRLKKLQEQELYQTEMERFTDEYVDYVKEIAYAMPSPPTVVIEQRIDYGMYAKEGFGTADCILIQGNSLHIIDFKYGKGKPVDAQDNPQLALYALGAIAAYGFIYPIEDVTMHIVQPRLNNNSSWSIPAKTLIEWGNLAVKPAADLAWEGTGEFREGKYCDSCFCKIGGVCRCRAENNMALMADAEDPETGKTVSPAMLSNEEIGQILKKAQFLKDWVTKLEKYALNTIVAGGDIPGWKIVEGRSNRAFSDCDAVVSAAVSAGYDKALLYETKPVALTAMEAIIDKETWQAAISPYIIKPQGKPTLAPEDDKRPQMQVSTSAEEAFGGANQYKEE